MIWSDDERYTRVAWVGVRLQEIGEGFRLGIKN